jgi:hypothetical protein
MNKLFGGALGQFNKSGQWQEGDASFKNLKNTIEKTSGGLASLAVHELPYVDENGVQKTMRQLYVSPKFVVEENTVSKHDKDIQNHLTSEFGAAYASLNPEQKAEVVNAYKNNDISSDELGARLSRLTGQPLPAKQIAPLSGARMQNWVAAPETKFDLSAYSNAPINAVGRGVVTAGLGVANAAKNFVTAQTTQEGFVDPRTLPVAKPFNFKYPLGEKWAKTPVESQIVPSSRQATPFVFGR